MTPREPIDTSAVREQNSSLLLELIWRERQISRADISRRTGLSPSTVSAIVAELREASLVREIGAGASRGGRKPTLLAFCDDAYVILGVELGARHVSACVIDLRGNVRAAAELPNALHDRPRETLAAAAKLAADCMHAARVSRKQLIGIGIAVASPVDPGRPGRLSELFLPAWSGIDLRATFAESHGVPVFMENDANMGALAERFWGAGQDAAAIAYIKVGAGIGAGFVFGGELYRGAGGVSGEIGHIPIDPNGPCCICGNRGCIAMYIGAAALSEQARARFGEGAPHTVAEIVRRAKSGDIAAREIIDGVGQSLGMVVAGLLNTLNPQLVVLGGEITAVGDLLLDPLRASVRGRALASVFAQTRIVTSQLGARSVCVGAATCVLARALRDRSLFIAPAQATA
jgi:predicted NBD/HSP70 family sugar kinase